MRERSVQSILNLGRRKPSGQVSLEGLVELLPVACLVVEAGNQAVLYGNPAATRLLGLPGEDLERGDLNSLFIDWANPPLPRYEVAPPLELHISHPSGSIQAVRLTLQPVPQSKSLLLAFLEPLAETTPTPGKAPLGWESLVEQLNSLVAAVDLPDLSSMLPQAVQAALAISRADLFAVYLAGARSPELILTACAGDAAPLPEQLPAQDLVHLAAPALWNESKRSHTALHRASRKTGYLQVATCPLGEPRAAIGLAVAAYRSPGSAGALPGSMELIARIITLLVNTDAVKADLVAADLTLQRAAQYETTAANAIREGLVLLSPELQVLIMNAAAEQIFGYRRQEVIHTTVENILIGNQKITPRLQEACDTLQAVRLDGLHLFRRYGETFPAIVEALPLPLDGRLDRLLVIIQDLSESEQIREQARQLEQRALLGEFTAIFAHEVRNPINNISTGLELMAMNLPEHDSQQGLLQRLQQDCDRLAELMKSVLTFARPADTNLQPVMLPELVQKLMDRLAPRLEKAHVRQHLQVEGNIPVVMADYRSLEQALNNIIQNAITAMGEAGGQLNLKIRNIKPARGKSLVETRMVEISIADTGPGIPKEIQERIFQPFFTTSSSGNGLGLAITRRIINAHKGTIHLESFPGGTVFFIRLPPAEPE